MATILTDISHSAILPACQENLYLYFRGLRHWEKADFSESPTLWSWLTPLPHPWFNGVLSLRPAESDPSKKIREALVYFKSSDVSAFTWWLAPGAEAWGTHLEAHGFKYNNAPPGMVVELDHINEDLRIPEGLKVIPVMTNQEIETWAHVFTLGYGLPLEWEPDILDMMVDMKMEEAQSVYLAYMDDTPVAASAMFLGAGVAGIYNVGTLPEWRGKGIGAAVTLQPLLIAREKGYRIGTLQSSEMGYKVYERLGFREMFKASHYYFDTWN